MPRIAGQNADYLEGRLRSLPYFSGGSWPEVTISVSVTDYDSDIGGCWALLIPDILLWPGWWLVGAPILCYWASLEATWDVQVGGFHRQYTFDLLDYSVWGMYYDGESLPPGDTYLGHTLWELTRKLAEDFTEFQGGRLGPNPAPYDDTLDPDDGDWYDPLSEGLSSCYYAPLGAGASVSSVGNTGVVTVGPGPGPTTTTGNQGAIGDAAAMGTEIGTYVASQDPAVRSQAARAIGTRAAWHIVGGIDDGSALEAVLSDPQYGTEDPTVRTAVGEALGFIVCARRCTAAAAGDCAAACNLPPRP